MNEDGSAAPKIFVADTSTLIQDPDSIETLADRNNTLIIPTCVLDEIDDLNNHGNGTSFAAREVNRKLDNYSSKGTDVRTPNGGKIEFVSASESTFTKLVKEGLGRKNDTRIIAVALDQTKKQKARVILVTCDLNMRVKARSKHLLAQDYEHSKIITQLGDIFPGFIETGVQPVDFALLNELCTQRELPIKRFENLFDIQKLLPNEFVEFVMLDEDQRSVHAIFKRREQVIRWIGKIPPKETGKAKKIQPTNKEQLYALALLNDPAIRLVSIIGPAGTGKTLMSLLGGWGQVTGDDEGFNCLTVFRPNCEIGNPMGFLPGEVDEKFAPWTTPIIGNLGFIVNDEEHHSKKERTDRVRQLILDGIIQIGPINFIRGDNFYREFIILDDGQNLTKAQMKALVTRTAFGSKLVITGDLKQIDNPLVDERSNGLIHLITSFTEHFKSHPDEEEIYGHINMSICQRSKLTEIANMIL